jgi:hypothetical protein
VGAARDDDPEVQQLKKETESLEVEQKAHTREEEARVHGDDASEQVPHQHTATEEKQEKEREEWPDPANREELVGIGRICSTL